MTAAESVPEGDHSHENVPDPDASAPQHLGELAVNAPEAELDEALEHDLDQIVLAASVANALTPDTEQAADIASTPEWLTIDILAATLEARRAELEHYVIRIMGTKFDEYRDVVSETYIKLHRYLAKHPDKLIPVRAARAMLYRTAGRTAIDFLRHRSGVITCESIEARDAQGLLDLEAYVAGRHNQGDPTRIVEAREVLRFMFRRIGPEATALLVLRDFTLAEDADIARMLHIAPEDVALATSRAREKARRAARKAGLMPPASNRRPAA